MYVIDSMRRFRIETDCHVTVINIPSHKPKFIIYDFKMSVKYSQNKAEKTIHKRHKMSAVPASRFGFVCKQGGNSHTQSFSFART